MAISKGGYFPDKVEKGRYGPIFPKTPACYGFSILAKIIPGREDVFYQYAKNIEETDVAAQPDALAVLQLHYLRWVLFPIKGDTYFMYQGIFDTDFDKYTEDAVTLFGITGLRTASSKSSWRASLRTGSQIAAFKLSAIINARASSNTLSTPMRAPLKSKKRSN